MKQRALRSTALVILLVVVTSLSVAFQSASNSQGTVAVSQAETNFEDLARRANQGDEQALNDLAGAITLKDQLNSVMPGAGDSIKERLLRAEKDHRRGIQRGLTSKDASSAESVG